MTRIYHVFKSSNVVLIARALPNINPNVFVNPYIQLYLWFLHEVEFI